MIAKLKGLSLLFLTAILLSSCYSLRQPKLERGTAFVPWSRDTVHTTAYVVNPSEFPDELIILKRSGLYTLSNDSLCPFKIRLRPLKQQRRMLCMTGPAAVMIISLGQFPVRLPEDYIFRYYAMENGETTEVEYELSIDRRIWFWDTFSFKKDLKKALAKNIKSRIKE